MVIAYTKLFRCQKQAKFFNMNRREIIQRIYTLLASWTVTPSLAWLDPSQLRRCVIACNANGNVPASSHARLGDNYSLVQPDPSSHRDIMNCILQMIAPLRKLGSGHRRHLLGMFHVKIMCGISLNMMEL